MYLKQSGYEASQFTYSASGDELDVRFIVGRSNLIQYGLWQYNNFNHKMRGNISERSM
jgi:hypothetical protein